MAQLGLFAAPPRLPEGFRHREDFLSAGEEAELAARLAELAFEPFLFRGVAARRRVVSFGWKYESGRARLEPTTPIPDWLAAVRVRAEAFAGAAPGALQQVLINDYRPRAPIGWHRDRPIFDEVVGVSLLSPCAFRFRRRTATGFERALLTLAPRSAYVLSGPARTDWEHSIPPVEQRRCSITFRSFR